MSAGALDGIKVFEFANYVSGPYAGMLLSDLGAEVVKVETPDGGDPFANDPPPKFCVLDGGPAAPTVLPASAASTFIGIRP